MTEENGRFRQLLRIELLPQNARELEDGQVAFLLGSRCLFRAATGLGIQNGLEIDLLGVRLLGGRGRQDANEIHAIP